MLGAAREGHWPPNSETWVFLTGNEILPTAVGQQAAWGCFRSGRAPRPGAPCDSVIRGQDGASEERVLEKESAGWIHEVSPRRLQRINLWARDQSMCLLHARTHAHMHAHMHARVPAQIRTSVVFIAVAYTCLPKLGPAVNTTNSSWTITTASVVLHLGSVSEGMPFLPVSLLFSRV